MDKQTEFIESKYITSHLIRLTNLKLATEGKIQNWQNHNEMLEQYFTFGF